MHPMHAFAGQLLFPSAPGNPAGPQISKPWPCRPCMDAVAEATRGVERRAEAQEGDERRTQGCGGVHAVQASPGDA